MPTPILRDLFRRIAPGLLLGGGLLAWGAAPTAWAGEVTYAPVAGKSKLVVTGTSSLHDWEMVCEEVGGTLVLDEAVTTQEALAAQPRLTSADQHPALEVSVTAESLKSEKGKKMDTKAYEALKTDAHPVVTYKLTSMVLKEGEPTAPSATVLTQGLLTIAGAEKEVAFPMNLRALPEGELELTGEVALSMADFGMKAPTALLGAIKTGDAVTVNFTWVVAPK